MSASLDAATRAHFTARAATYSGGGDESLRAMLDLAAPQRGERVLDVATGTGLVLFRLAEAVGVGGLAAGIDFTPAMLEQAASRRAEMLRKSAPEAGWPSLVAPVAPVAPVALVAADAVRLPFFEACFDVITCRFSVHHMSDAEAGLAAMAAALRPGGRLVIADFVRPDATDAPGDPDAGAQHDELERLRGHVYGRIYERASLERLMAGDGCPVQEARPTERAADPRDWLSLPHLTTEDRETLAGLVDEITTQGAGAGFEVKRDGDGDTVRFVREDVVLLGIKGG